jgi:hypothetical protein
MAGVCAAPNDLAVSVYVIPAVLRTSAAAAIPIHTGTTRR